MSGEIHLGLADALKVALDGVGRAVLGPQVPLEGAEQRAQGGAVHGSHDGTVMMCPSVMRRSQTGRNRRLTSVSAGQSVCGAPRRNRTADTILTIDGIPS